MAVGIRDREGGVLYVWAVALPSIWGSSPRFGQGADRPASGIGSRRALVPHRAFRIQRSWAAVRLASTARIRSPSAVGSEHGREPGPEQLQDSLGPDPAMRPVPRSQRQGRLSPATVVNRVPVRGSDAPVERRAPRQGASHRRGVARPDDRLPGIVQAAEAGAIAQEEPPADLAVRMAHLDLPASRRQIPHRGGAVVRSGENPVSSG